jgi:CP family cyanate transporter-like MFS transporter
VGWGRSVPSNARVARSAERHGKLVVVPPPVPPTPAPTSSPADPRAGRRRAVILLAAVVLVALSLRAPLLAIAPVTGQVRSGLHIGSATAGLFTSIPVLLFALAAPPALVLLVRAGLDRVMLFALLGIALGTLVRSAGALPVALVGTVLLGLAVGVGNVAAPVAIGRDFPARSGPVTGVYTASLNVGSMLASLLTAPLADVVGWRWALASWSAVALIAAAVWWIVAHRVRPRPVADQATPDVKTDQATTVHPTTVDASHTDGAGGSDGIGIAMWRRPVALLLTAAFACQSFGYYGITAWLPSLLADERGLSRAAAGVSSSVFQVLGIIGAISVPYLIHRGFSRRAVMIAVCTGWLVLPIGLIAAPAAWPLWCAFGGAAQGGGITIIFILVLAQVDGVGERQRMSTLVQGLGYGLGATGPTVIGAVHQATGSWTAPLLVIAVAMAGLTAAGVLAATLGRTTATR